MRTHARRNTIPLPPRQKYDPAKEPALEAAAGFRNAMREYSDRAALYEDMCDHGDSNLVRHGFTYKYQVAHCAAYYRWLEKFEEARLVTLKNIHNIENIDIAWFEYNRAKLKEGQPFV